LPTLDVRSVAAEHAAPTEDIRELGIFAGAMAVIALLFAVIGAGLLIGTGDVASGAGALMMLALAAVLVYARRQLKWRPQRAAILTVVGMLVFVLVSSPIPPPVPALAATPIVAVAFALTFLRGRQLIGALVAAWVVSLAAAFLIEITPASPDLPVQLAAALRVAAVGALVGLVALVLYRHRRRLERAVTTAEIASDALRESEARYRTVVEGVHEVIFRIDRHGRWALLNRAWDEMTGYTVPDSIGRSIIDFIHPEDRQVHTDLARHVARGERDEYRHELRLVGSEGAEIWIEAHARPVRDEADRFQGMSGTLVDVTVRHALEKRLQDQAFHDDLTGLANRALFRDRVEHALAQRSQGPRLGAVLFLDLDRFKTINDSLGHQVGDDLLVAIAQRLQNALAPEDTIARLGGDEFGILREDVATPNNARLLAQGVSAVFGTPFQVGDREITIGCSIGMVLASGVRRTADELLRDADVAMYHAKVAGRGSYAVFEPSMQAEVAARRELESDLRDAIEHEQLSVAYQPIVDMKSRKVVAVEALARWAHPVRGDVSPAAFIAVAEESDLILSLGAWVLRRACSEIATLRKLGKATAEVRLNVNFSARQISERTIVEDVLGALHDAGLPPSALDIEITESLVLECGEEEMASLRRLRAAGCGVSFDDFGTGFSSLGNLRSLPIDGLKIDISFVSAMLVSVVEAEVVEAVIRLGAALKLAVVAEGVEDAETAERLTQLGCPLGQGYFFGRPDTIAALTARLTRLRVIAAA
jgi:diguanylate cyclase (GGDEF)-like protein/PAS domain S-box-containing protein